jgi:hypothetical protein
MKSHADKSTIKLNTEDVSWTKRLNFAMLTVWLLVGVALSVFALVRFGKDFRGYYAAAEVLISGGNPYDYNLVAQVLLEVTGIMGNNPYYYPPWFLWIFLPLTALSFPIARVIWMAVNFILWNVGLWQLNKLTGWPRIGWQLYGLFAVTTCCFAWITWKYEQAGILVFVMLVLLIISIQEGKTIWSGIWMALLLIKPNITLIVVAGVGLWLFRKGQWRTVLVAMVTLLVLLSISTWITPDWYEPFLQEGFGQGLSVVLDGPDKVIGLRLNTTLLGWLTMLGVERQFHSLIYGISILLGVAVFLWTVHKSSSPLQLISILLLISLALTPYALQYDYAPLAIALFWALSLCAFSYRALIAALILLGFIFSIIFWQENIAWGYWMVIDLIIMAILGLHQKTKFNQRSSSISQPIMKKPPHG